MPEEGEAPKDPKNSLAPWVLITVRALELIRVLARYGLYVWLAYCAKESISAIATQTTSNIRLSIEGFFSLIFSLGHENILLSLACGASWIVAICSLIYGILERRERHKKATYLQDRIIKLEQELDPERTSSMLPRSGETGSRDGPQ
jgi:heme exporter protein D